VSNEAKYNSRIQGNTLKRL